MTSSFALSPAHVAGLSSHIEAAVRESILDQTCAGRGRVLQGITGFLKPTNPVRKASVANSSRDGRLLTARIERTRTHRAPLAVSAFIQSGLTGSLNLRGGFKALRSLSFRSRVQFCQEPAHGILSTFQFPPVAPSAVVHVEQHHRRMRQGVVT